MDSNAPSELLHDSTKPAESETKDFAEHLRSVHFTLGVVCLGLIVIATQPTRPELRTAYDQTRDITEVAGHLSPFRTSLFETDAVTQVDEFKKTQSPAFGRLDLLPNPPKALEINGKRYNVVFNGRNWGFLWVSPPLNTMLEAGVVDGAQLKVSSPKNLADFRLLWDGAADVMAWGGGELSSYACVRKGSSFGGISETWLKWNAVAPSPKYKTLALSLGALHFSDEVAVPQPLRGHLRHAFVSEEGMPQIVIPTVTEIPVAIVDGQALLIRADQGRWHHGNYVRAFEELYAVTHDYERVDLKTIERIVGSELERSKDVFQAFGITFPVETTASWGVLLVLAIQVYFLFHLVEFRRRNMQNVTIAWIGLYRGWGPRLLFVASSCVFPVVVVSYVAPKSGIGRFSPPTAPWLFAGSLIGLSFVVAALSAREYWRIQTTKVPTLALPVSGSGATPPEQCEGEAAKRVENVAE